MTTDNLINIMSPKPYVNDNIRIMYNGQSLMTLLFMSKQADIIRKREDERIMKMKGE